MKLKLETKLSTKLLISAIFLGLFYTFFIFLFVMPVTDPMIFWSSFFLLWFVLGFFGIIWAGDDDLKEGLFAILLGVLILVFLFASRFSSSMFTIFQAHGGFSVGIAGASALYIVKRMIDRKRGMPLPPTRPIYAIEKDLFVSGTMSVVITTYILTTWHFGLIQDRNSVWFWIGIVLAILWFFSIIKLYYTWYYE